MRRLLLALLIVLCLGHGAWAQPAPDSDNSDDWKHDLDTFFHGYTRIVEELIARRNFYAADETLPAAMPLLDWNRTLADDVFQGFHRYIQDKYPDTGFLDPGGHQAPVWHGETELSLKLHSAKLDNLTFAITFENRTAFFRSESYSPEPQGFALLRPADDIFFEDIVKYSFGLNPCPDLISVTWVKSEADALGDLPGAMLLRSDIHRPYFPVRTLLLPAASDVELGGTYLTFEAFLAHAYAGELENGYLDVQRILQCAAWADAVKLVARTVNVKAQTRIELAGHPLLVVADKLTVADDLDPALTLYVEQGARVDDFGAKSTELVQMGGSLDPIELEAQLELAKRAFLEGSSNGLSEARQRLERILGSEQPNVSAIELFLAERVVPEAAPVAFADWEAEGQRDTFGGFGGKAAPLFDALLQYGKLLSGQDYFGVRQDYVPALTSHALRSRFEERLLQYKDFYDKRVTLIEKTKELDQVADRARAEIEFIKTAEEPIVELRAESLSREVEVSKAAIDNLNGKIVDLEFQIVDLEAVQGYVAQLIECIGCGKRPPDAYSRKIRDQTAFNNAVEKSIRLIESESAIAGIGSTIRDLAYQIRAKTVEGQNLVAQLEMTHFERAGLEQRIHALNDVVAGSTDLVTRPSAYDAVLKDLEIELIKLGQRRRNALLYEYKLAPDTELSSLSFDASDPAAFTRISIALDRVRDQMFEAFGVRGSPDDVRIDYDQSYLVVRLLEGSLPTKATSALVGLDITDLKRTGFATVEVGYRDPPSAPVAALDRALRTAELVDAEVWYSLVAEPLCKDLVPLDLRVILEHGALESTISYRTGTLQTYDVSDLDLKRTMHATRRDALLKDNFYENPNYTFVRENLGRTAAEHFAGLSPATAWRIKIADGETPEGQVILQCLADVNLVLLFNYR